MRVFDYFCGMGGLSYGFKQAGYSIEEGIDNWPVALKTYTEYIEAPGREIDIQDYYPGRNDFAIIVGGTPCQDFSIANKKRNIYSKRSQLILDFCRIVHAVQPEVFVFENVSHLSRWGAEALKEMPNYKVTEALVNTAEYGVPQSRKRKIFIGAKKRHIAINPPLGLKIHTVREAFEAIPENWGFCRHRPETIERFKKVTSTSWISNTSSDYQGTIRLSWDTPSCGVGNVKKFRILHPEEHRVISLAEALALQGFPSWYVPKGTDTQKAIQIADAVPPRLAYYIAKTIQSRLS